MMQVVSIADCENLVVSSRCPEWQIRCGYDRFAEFAEIVGTVAGTILYCGYKA
jgi:hypothetical protein